MCERSLVTDQSTHTQAHPTHLTQPRSGTLQGVQCLEQPLFCFLCLCCHRCLCCWRHGGGVEGGGDTVTEFLQLGCQEVDVGVLLVLNQLLVLLL